MDTVDRTESQTPGPKAPPRSEDNDSLLSLQDLFSRALQAKTRKDWTEAIELLEEAKNLHGASPDISFHLIECFQKLRDYSRSVKTFFEYCHQIFDESSNLQSSTESKLTFPYSIPKTGISKISLHGAIEAYIVALKQMENIEQAKYIYYPFYQQNIKAIFDYSFNEFYAEEIISEFLRAEFCPHKAILQLADHYFRKEQRSQAETWYSHLTSSTDYKAYAYHQLSILTERSGDLILAFQYAAEAHTHDPVNYGTQFLSFQKINEIHRVGYLPRTPIIFETLSLRQRVYLGALLRCCLNEKQNLILSYDESGHKLAPRITFAMDILRTLDNSGMIAFSPETLPSAVTLDETGKMKSYFLSKARWTLNISSETSLTHSQILHLLCNPEVIEPTDDSLHQEITSIWADVALEECLEFLDHERENVGLGKEIGEKTAGYFADLLKDFSTAQIYNHIWSSVKSALYMKEKNKMGKAHAANLVANLCKSRGEKAKAENWEIKPYKRNFECPQSIVSQHFFCDILGIGEKGFNSRPGSW